jgi:hypothetical protein
MGQGFFRSFPGQDMLRRIYPKDLVWVTIAAFAFIPVLAILLGCNGPHQEAGKVETPSEPSTPSVSALPTTPGTQQPPPQGSQGKDPPENYEGLEVGEPAEFKNGLSVTVEGAYLLVQAPSTLEERLEPDDLLVVMYFSVENTNPEGQMPYHTFDVTTALWQARDQNGTPLQTLYPLETSLIAGELPNPRPDYPYLGWQGELGSGQKQQGSMLFVAQPSTKMRVRFTQPVMNPPVGEWELGSVSELPQAP